MFTQIRTRLITDRGDIIHNEDRCAHCGRCEGACKFGAIEVDMAKGEWELDEWLCLRCGACTRACPSGCLSLTKGRPMAV